MPSVTITASVQAGNRVLAALGKVMRLVDGNGAARDATLNEYADWLRSDTKRMVLDQERQDALASLPAPVDFTLT